MHGLVIRSIQCFVRDTYGPARWKAVVTQSGVQQDSFETLRTYDDKITVSLLTTAAKLLDRTIETVLEDLGTYLVSHDNSKALRRLLRFGGVTFMDFLYTIEDLPARARLAVPDLVLPEMELEEVSDGSYRLKVGATIPGISCVIEGILRAMADDYGALVIIDHLGGDPNADGGEVLNIQILDQTFATGRDFTLSQEAWA